MRHAFPSLIVGAALLAAVAPHAQTAAQPPPAVFRTGTELVLVNVVVRDRSGAIVRGLRQSDFVVSEDDKVQTVTSFDFEEPDRANADTPLPAEAVLGTATPSPRAAVPQPNLPPAETRKVDMRGRRLMVMFFDLSSMEPEAVTRAVRAAHEYVDRKLAPADLIGVASFSTSLRVDQDFTTDRSLLDAAIDRFGGAGSGGLEAGTTGDPEGTPDNGAAFTPDDTEFNIFNADRRLEALQWLCDALSGIDQKKSVIYFSSGMNQSGQDNQVELRRAVDRANRANVSIYAADMRGLQAMVPGGDASQASTRGVSAFSGASVANQFSQLASSQDTLTTIAEDTGGRAFYDSNAFGDVFDRVVADTSAYYVLGYSSTNTAPRRTFSTDQSASQGYDPQARPSLRLLRAARLCAFNARRSRAATPGSDAVRPVGHRPQRLRHHRLFPSRRKPLFRAHLGRRARVPGAVQPDDGQESRDHRRLRPGARRTGPAGRPDSRFGEDRSRSDRRPEAQDRSV
jgi:VWFA-related protein